MTTKSKNYNPIYILLGVIGVAAIVMVGMAIAIDAQTSSGSGLGQVLNVSNVTDGQDIIFTDGDVINNPALVALDNDLSNPSYSEGTIFYDSIEKALGLYNSESEVTQQLGQENYIRVYNETGSTITDGSVVYISGTEGVENRPTIDLAVATARSTSEVLGFATHDIEDATFGFVTYWGLVNNLDTSSFVTGDILFLSSIAAGTFSIDHPGTDNYLVQLGYVVRAHASLGRILVTLEPDLASSEQPITKSYSITTQGGFGSGDFWAGGYYDFASADANLTQASTTVNYGTTNNPWGAHASMVTSGAGSVDTGTVSVVVSGTSITEGGVRTTSDSETILVDITTATVNGYYETAKKWLGQVTYTLTETGGSPTTYSLDFNYGFSKYDDYGNADFTVIDFEAVGTGGATDTGFEIVLYHHHAEGWIYAVTGFTPTSDVIVSSVTDLGGDDNLAANVPFAYKRTNLTHFVAGGASEGVLIRVTTSANNAIEFMDMHIGVHLD